MNQGVDISNNNDITDWTLIKQTGVQTIIQKATQGINYIDSLLRLRYARIKAIALKFGAYHFAGGQHTPEEEAQYFLTAIAGLTLDTVAFLDIEDYSTTTFTKTWGKQEAYEFVNAFTNCLGAKGYGKGVYCNKSFYEDYLKGNILSDIKVWIADYGQQPTEYPATSSWQYSDTGSLNGATGNLDLDYFLDNIFITGTVAPQVLAPLPNDFSESYYLAMNKDVALAVGRKQYTSGANHYQIVGYKEDRPYTPPIPKGWNEGYYLQSNDSVQVAVTLGQYKSGLDHYIQHGWNENRECVPKATIKYAAFVQDVGLQNAVEFNEVAGTIGKGLRIEALTIDYNGIGILTFQAYLQGTGWQPLVGNGQMAGTLGESLRIEAIKIFLDGSPMTLTYSVQVQNKGWSDYVPSGFMAGTTGEGLRLEAIKIKLV